MLCRALVVLAIFSTSLVAGTATAQSAASPQDMARSIGEEGLALFGKEKWQEAYARFQSAEMMFHAPTLVLYMARCQVKLGHWIGARELYRSIENEKLPTNASTAFVNARKEAAAELATLMPQIPVLVLEIENPPDSGVRIRLDGREVEPQRLRNGMEVNPGEHVAQVSAEGRDTATYTFQTSPGKPTRATIPLLVTSSVAQEKPAVSGLATEKPGPRDPLDRVDPLWLGIGAGATLLATSAGVVGVVVSNNASSELDDMEASSRSGTSSHERWDDANARRVDYGNFAVWSFVTSGVAALATGVYLGVAVLQDEDSAPTAVLVPSGPGLGGFSVAGRW